jgi:hypothetical protein
MPHDNDLIRIMKAVRNCSLIAYLYKDGLARCEWTTQKGALETLGISAAELSLALRLDALPAEIVDLFESRGSITPHAVRVISETLAKDGLEAVTQRAKPHLAAGSKFSTRVALATLKGNLVASTRALRGKKTAQNAVPNGAPTSPRNLSDRYHIGVLGGRWASYSGCARELNISRKIIRDAVCIEALMLKMPYASGLTEVSFTSGRKFLALEKQWGREKLAHRLTLLTPHMQGASSDHLIRALVGANVQPADLTRIRITKGRGRKRLVIECDHASFLYTYRREFEQAMQQVLKRLTQSPEGDEMFRMVLASQQFENASALGRVRKVSAR